MIRALICDIDGTLIDSVPAHIEAWKRAFARFGKEVSDEEIRHQIGKGNDDMLPVFFSREKLDRFRLDLEKYRGELFKREYLPSLKPFPRVRDLFECIKHDGIKIALGSTAKGEDIAIYKEMARIEDLVTCAVCSEEVEHSKPHRDICAVALDKLGLPAEQVLAIGDTAYDVESASKMSVCSIGFLCGGGTKDELERAGCVAVYSHPADLLEHYDGSPLSRPVVSNIYAADEKVS